MKTWEEKDKFNQEALAHAWLSGPGGGLVRDGGALIRKLAEYAQYLRREWEESTEYDTGGETDALAWLLNAHAYTVPATAEVYKLAVTLSEYVRYCRSRVVKPASSPQDPPLAPFSITGPGKYETVGQATVTIEALPGNSLYIHRPGSNLRWYAPLSWFAYNDAGKAWIITTAGLIVRRPDYDLAKTL